MFSTKDLEVFVSKSTAAVELKFGELQLEHITCNSMHYLLLACDVICCNEVFIRPARAW